MKYFILFLFFCSTIKAQNANLFFEETNLFLKKYVSIKGEVNYESINKNKKSLTNIFTIVKEIDIEKENLNTQKAFWINIYNLIVIKQVIENYGIKNVNSVPNFFNKKNSIAKKEVTLDYIEHTILRANKYDPRYHFVLYCAAKDGAKLLNKAYTPKKLQEQMENQTKEKINSENYFEIDNEKNILYLNQIYEWYEKDFKIIFSNVIDFINLYSNSKIKKGYEIKYYEFNWELI